jgi:hypothetical protein
MFLSVIGRCRRGRCAGLLEQWLHGLRAIYQHLIINLRTVVAARAPIRYERQRGRSTRFRLKPAF